MSDTIEELRAYSATSFMTEEAYHVAAAIHVVHRLRCSRPAGISEENLAARQQLLNIVLRMLKNELLDVAGELNDRLMDWREVTMKEAKGGGS